MQAKKQDKTLQVAVSRIQSLLYCYSHYSSIHVLGFVMLFYFTFIKNIFFKDTNVHIFLFSRKKSRQSLCLEKESTKMRREYKWLRRPNDGSVEHCNETSSFLTAENYFDS
jgi:hypothetical protein